MRIMTSLRIGDAWASIKVKKYDAIGCEAAAGDEVAERVDRGQMVPGRKRDDQLGDCAGGRRSLLVLRFRSSHQFAASSIASFGSKGALATL
jgi:hypothetical protein